MAQTYRSALLYKNFQTNNKAIVAGQFNKLGEYVVQAGETVTLGYGAIASQSDAVGRIYGAIYDTAGTPVELKGKLRISIYSPQDRPLKIVDEFRTEALNTSQTDRTKQTPYAEHMEVITEDKKIVIEFYPDAVGSGSVNATASSLIFDITQGIV